MLYNIQNSRFSLAICSRGAELWDLKALCEPETPLLWSGAADIWPWRAPVCFPWCGKLADGWFAYCGHRYKGGQHGFIRDLEHQLIRSGMDSLTFHVEWPGDKERWPWRFSFDTHHQLDMDELHTTCIATNLSDQPMPAQLGFHPGLRFPMPVGKFPGDYIIRFEQNDAPDGGNILALRAGWTFENKRIVIKNPRSAWVQLEERNSGRHMRVNIENYPYVLFWSKPELPGFVCIEPWTGLSGEGHDLQKRPGAIMLDPGQSLQKALVITSNIYSGALKTLPRRPR